MSESGKRILVVEDDENILQLVQTLLESSGYEVSLARNGLEGMNAVTQRPPDLVVLDVMLPKVDGFNICRFIKGSNAFQNVKVVLLTAMRFQLDAQKAKDLGADEYFIKPLNFEVFLDRIKELVPTK